MLSKDKHRMIMFRILKDIFNGELWNNFAFK